MFKNINNKKIYRNTLRIKYPYTINGARSWIKRSMKARNRKSGFKWAIDINSEVAGGIGLVRIEGHQAEIGYWLAEKYWGQGIMTRAVRLVVNYGFNRLKLKRIFAYVFTFNKASQKVLFKSGFKKEGLLKKHAEKNGKYYDDYLYAKIK